MHARRRGVGLLAVLVLAGGVAAGCTSEAGDARTPQQRLAAAKTQLDETSGVRIELTAERLPKGVSGLLSADGVGTHDPAFEGTITVLVGGLRADVPVVAVDGAVFAKLPYTTDFAEVEPDSYGAPDPADLMDTEHGLSALLTAARDVEEGDRVREGEAVLSELTGTVPGQQVAAILPSAEADAGFEMRARLDDSDRLQQMILTGPFYAGTEDVSYRVELSQYDVERDITAP